MLGWQEYAIADEVLVAMTTLPPGVDPTVAIGVFGVTGMTAYFGLLDIGRPKPGDTVVVSGAARATGSVVGRLARIEDAGSVVGIAGSAEKCEWLTGELGFAHAINYRDDVSPRLGAVCPEGIDVYFDNVGGQILDDCLAHLAMKARVVLCGPFRLQPGPSGGAQQLPQPPDQAGPDGGLPHPRLRRPVPRGSGPHGRMGHGGTDPPP